MPAFSKNNQMAPKPTIPSQTLSVSSFARPSDRAPGAGVGLVGCALAYRSSYSSSSTLRCLCLRCIRLRNIRSLSFRLFRKIRCFVFLFFMLSSSSSSYTLSFASSSSSSLFVLFFFEGFASSRSLELKAPYPFGNST